jgi:hypothetical protein
MHRHNIVSRGTAALLALGMLACDEEQTPTAPAADEALLLVGPPPAATDVSAMGTLPLPVNQAIASAVPALKITQRGTGPVGFFQIDKATNSTVALLGQTNGTGIAVRGLATSPTGRAGVFESTNGTGSQDVLFAKANNNGTAVHAVANGFGMAGSFQGMQNTGSNTLFASAIGAGTAISAVNTGPGQAGMFVTTSPTNQSSALLVQSAGNTQATVRALMSGRAAAGDFEITNPTNPSPAIAASTKGLSPAAFFGIFNPSNSQEAMIAQTDGSGWAGTFLGTSKGVRINTTSGVGLQVIGGSKQAVVGTLTGARSLYTEESSEVWFTDYGFARTEQGRARILIDPIFAQTINSDEPYHVFVEEYGDAQLYVAERTPLGFVVRNHGGLDVEFSYRIVARRRGFETDRLERAPWADQSPGLGKASRTD